MLLHFSNGLQNAFFGIGAAYTPIRTSISREEGPRLQLCSSGWMISHTSITQENLSMERLYSKSAWGLELSQEILSLFSSEKKGLS